MATADTSGGGSDGGGPVCARDFIVDRLREADSPLSPAELADEYGCTNGHVRNVLADLRGEGAVVRVGHGKYSDPESGSEDSDTEQRTEIAPDDEESAEEDTDGEGAESRPYPSADGPHLLADTDTMDQDGQEDGEMPSEEELERQREQADSDDGEDDETDSEMVEAEPVEVVEESASMGIPIPMDARKLMMVVAIGAVLFILWQASQSGGSSGSGDSASEEEPEPEPATVESPGGGLVSQEDY